MDISSPQLLFAETLELSFFDHGSGRPYLLLHGGAGPQSMNGLAAALQTSHRSIAPTHPGFDGKPRPDWFGRINDLALAYLALLERLALQDVVIVGNSIGGWIAAEMALRNSPRIAGIVLLNACGIDTGSSAKQIVDPMKLSPADRAALAFHDPARYAIAPTSPAALAQMAENQGTLRVYSGEHFMHDPSLYGRLSRMPVPSLVAWGESDGIVDVAYGQRFAGAMPYSRLELVPQAGHFPHIEQLGKVVALIEAFENRA
ncbi:alpha/beta fold hydrolase [Dyella monticola]|uniref:alpha/beta fold hydrolase n=1 Tax=Dyella monticola TaxID=1927958 RepID=UPI001E5357CD|nr:alpha/beta hydrolase [Dyella monticola]